MHVQRGLVVDEFPHPGRSLLSISVTSSSRSMDIRSLMGTSRFRSHSFHLLTLGGGVFVRRPGSSRPAPEQVPPGASPRQDSRRRVGPRLARSHCVLTKRRRDGMLPRRSRSQGPRTAPRSRCSATRHSRGSEEEERMQNTVVVLDLEVTEVESRMRPGCQNSSSTRPSCTCPPPIDPQGPN